MSNKPSSTIRRWAILSAIGLEMGAIIFGAVKLGIWLDNTYNDGNKMYLIIFTFIGIAISLFLVVKQTNSLNK